MPRGGQLLARWIPEARQVVTENSILFVSLPKSGTEFLSGGIRDAVGLELPWQVRDQALMNEYLSGYCNRADIYSTGVFVSERIVPEPLREVLPGGHVLPMHASATYHNLRAFADAGVRRLTVLVRDPRDSTVSWTYHLRALDASMRHFNSFIQHLPPDYYDWPHAEQLAFQVRTFLPSAVNWIESWLDAAAGDSPIEMQIVYFDELRRDFARCFARVFAFHAIGAYDLSRIQPPARGVRHYRKGEHDAWRSEFSESDRAMAESLIGERLRTAFDRAATRHPDHLAAVQAEDAGNDSVALARSVLLLRQFGAFRPAWERIERVMRRRGLAIDRAGVNANPFIIPEEALRTIEARCR